MQEKIYIIADDVGSRRVERDQTGLFINMDMKSLVQFHVILYNSLSNTKEICAGK